MSVPEHDPLPEQSKEPPDKNDINLVHVDENHIVVVPPCPGEPVEPCHEGQARLAFVLAEGQHLRVVWQIMEPGAQTQHSELFDATRESHQPFVKETEDRVVPVHGLRDDEKPHCAPSEEHATSKLSVMTRLQQVSSDAKEVLDQSMKGQESLGLSQRLEPSHLPFTLPIVSKNTNHGEVGRGYRAHHHLDPPRARGIGVCLVSL